MLGLWHFFLCPQFPELILRLIEKKLMHNYVIKYIIPEIYYPLILICCLKFVYIVQFQFSYIIYGVSDNKLSYFYNNSLFSKQKRKELL